MTFQNLADAAGILVVIVATYGPVVLSKLRTNAQTQHKDKLANAYSRAEIIVQALAMSPIASAAKKDKAMQKLSEYANEIHMNLTPAQASDYIESAYYAFIKQPQQDVSAIESAASADGWQERLGENDGKEGESPKG